MLADSTGVSRPTDASLTFWRYFLPFWIAFGVVKIIQIFLYPDPYLISDSGEYPKLDRWPRWKLAETAAAYVLVAGSLAKRLLIVVDKSDLAVLRLAKGSQFSKKWTAASEVDRAAYLR